MAGLPSLLYAVTNHLDKHLLEKFFHGDLGVLTLLCISAFVSAIAVPFLWFFSPESVIPDNWTHIFVFALVGFLHTALLWFYLTALNKEDTTTIIIFYSFLPVLGLVASNIFLGEVLLPMQLIAMAVIILGVLIVSFEKDGDSGIRFKLKVGFLMFMASLCWALGDVAFKFVALEENVWRSLFWEHVILTVVGIVMYITMPSIKTQITDALKRNSKWILSINMTSETIYIVANVVSAFPLVMVQVAAVHLVQSFQPVWVFLIAIGLWLLGYTKKPYNLFQMIQKSSATAIAVYGMYLLAVYTPA